MAKYNVKDLDNVEKFLRRGGTHVVSRNVIVALSCDFKLSKKSKDNDDYESSDKMYGYKWEFDYQTQKYTPSKFAAKYPVAGPQTVAVAPMSLRISLLYVPGGSKHSKYQMPTIHLITEKSEFDHTTKEYVRSRQFRGDLGKARREIILTEAEQAIIEGVQKTPLEWYRFFRGIRRRIQASVWKGEFTAIINRRDDFKEVKSTDKFIPILKFAQQLRAALDPFKGCDSVAQPLAPFIKIQNYGSMYHSTLHVTSNVESLLESLESLEEELREKGVKENENGSESAADVLPPATDQVR